MVTDENSHTLDPDQSTSDTLNHTPNTSGTFYAVVSSDDNNDYQQVDFTGGDGSGTFDANKIGWVRVNYHGENQKIPLYDPDSIPHACWRVQIDSTTTGAFYLQDRKDADFRSLSIETAGGPKGVSIAPQSGENADVSVDAPRELKTGDDFFADTTIENLSDTQISDTATLYWNGTQVDSQDFTINSGATDNFNLRQQSASKGSHKWRVNASDDEESGKVTVSDKTLVEDFEHNDLTSYWEGSTGHYHITDEDSYEGSFALRNNKDYVGAMINSFSGLPSYPTQGDKIICRLRTNFREIINPQTTPSIRFGHKSNSAFYECRLRIDEARMVITENHPDISGWNNIRVQDIDLTWPRFTDIRFEAYWGTDNIGMRVFNDETDEALTPYISGAPQYHTATDGGIGISLQTESADHDMIADYITTEPL